MVNETKKKNWFRRHWIISILLVILILGMFGAMFGGENSTNQESNKEPAKTYSIGDSIQAGDFKWKITKFTTAQSIGSNPYLTTEASGIYLILDVEVENTGNSAKYLMDSYLKLVDDQDREFSPDSGASIYLDSNQALLFEQVNPGIVKKGKIVFDVPENLNVANVRISSNLLSSSVYNVKLVI